MDLPRGIRGLEVEARHVRPAGGTAGHAYRGGETYAGVVQRRTAQPPRNLGESHQLRRQGADRGRVGGAGRTPPPAAGAGRWWELRKSQPLHGRSGGISQRHGELRRGPACLGRRVSGGDEGLHLLVGGVDPAGYLEERRACREHPY